MGKYLNGYRRRRVDGSALRAARLERVGRRRQRLPGVQLPAQRERHARPLRRPPARLPHRRARAQGQSRSSTRGRRAASRSCSRSRRSRRTRPYTPAPRDAKRLPGAAGAARRRPSTRRTCATSRRGCAATRRSTPAQISAIDSAFRKRAQSVQAVDDMIGRIEATAAQRDGVADNTYIVFSSDNGYHMGEHRLTPGKLTAFDTDIRVPLIVDRPGRARGPRRRRDDREHRPLPDLRRARPGAPSPPTSTATASCRCCAASTRPTGATRRWSSTTGRTSGLQPSRMPAAGQRQPADVRGAALPHSCTSSTRTASASTTTSTDPYELTNIVREAVAGTRWTHCTAQLAGLENCAGAVVSEAAGLS